MHEHWTYEPEPQNERGFDRFLSIVVDMNVRHWFCAPADEEVLSDFERRRARLSAKLFLQKLQPRTYYGTGEYGWMVKADGMLAQVHFPKDEYQVNTEFKFDPLHISQDEADELVVGAVHIPRDGWGSDATHRALGAWTLQQSPESMKVSVDSTSGLTEAADSSTAADVYALVINCGLMSEFVDFQGPGELYVFPGTRLIVFLMPEPDGTYLVLLKFSQLSPVFEQMQSIRADLSSYLTSQVVEKIVTDTEQPCLLTFDRVEEMFGAELHTLTNKDLFLTQEIPRLVAEYFRTLLIYFGNFRKFKQAVGDSHLIEGARRDSLKKVYSRTHMPSSVFARFREWDIDDRVLLTVFPVPIPLRMVKPNQVGELITYEKKYWYAARTIICIEVLFETEDGPEIGVYMLNDHSQAARIMLARDQAEDGPDKLLRIYEVHVPVLIQAEDSDHPKTAQELEKERQAVIAVLQDEQTAHLLTVDEGFQFD